jgi:hypothetical protein
LISTYFDWIAAQVDWIDAQLSGVRTFFPRKFKHFWQPTASKKFLVRRRACLGVVSRLDPSTRNGWPVVLDMPKDFAVGPHDPSL